MNLLIFVECGLDVSRRQAQPDLQKHGIAVCKRRVIFGGFEADRGGDFSLQLGVASTEHFFLETSLFPHELRASHSFSDG